MLSDKGQHMALKALLSKWLCRRAQPVLPPAGMIRFDKERGLNHRASHPLHTMRLCRELRAEISLARELCREILTAVILLHMTTSSDATRVRCNRASRAPPGHELIYICLAASDRTPIERPGSRIVVGGKCGRIVARAVVGITGQCAIAGARTPDRTSVFKPKARLGGKARLGPIGALAVV